LSIHVDAWRGTSVRWGDKTDPVRTPPTRDVWVKELTRAIICYTLAGPGQVPKLDRRIMLVWHPSGSPPAARAFLDLARHHLAGGEATAAR
jgi:DNA-binding transcriptional LysR family regulator